MNTQEVLLVTEQDRYVEFRMNRAEKRNALSADLVVALIQALEKYEHESWVRLIVLTGQGQAFSAGADLDKLKSLQSATIDENLQDSSQLASLFRMLYEYPVPILGAINGHALAGGCGLASMCDISVSVPQAKFGYTETRIGFVPAIVSKFLISKVGTNQAQRLLLGGEIITAEEAFRIGLITEVADHFDDRVSYWIHVFTYQVSPMAVKSTRKLIRDVTEMSVGDSIDYAVRLNADARMTDDCQRGIAAFLNKEKIVW
jgi:methylglutaconyl-CoA hydratase